MARGRLEVGEDVVVRGSRVTGCPGLSWVGIRLVGEVLCKL